MGLEAELIAGARMIVLACFMPRVQRGNASVGDAGYVLFVYAFLAQRSVVEVGRCLAWLEIRKVSECLGHMDGSSLRPHGSHWSPF